MRGPVVLFPIIFTALYNRIKIRVTGADDSNIRLPERHYQLDWIRFYLQSKAEQNGGSADDVIDSDIEEYYVKTVKFTLVTYSIYSIYFDTKDLLYFREICLSLLK